VFYLPSPGKEEHALGGMAAALIARMADFQQLLKPAGKEQAAADAPAVSVDDERTYSRQIGK
jgi:hypothetical protein